MRATEDTMQVVIFFLGDIEFGVDILQVREIERHIAATRVPRVPDYIEGVINLRGQLVPVVDLRSRLGMRAKPPTKDTRIIVAQLGERRIGMTVDRVREVTRIPVEHIEAKRSLLAGLEAEYVARLARIDNRVVILLAVDKILAAGSFSDADKERS